MLGTDDSAGFGIDIFDLIQKEKTPVTGEFRPTNQYLWSRNGALKGIYKQGELMERIVCNDIRKSKNATTNFAFEETDIETNWWGKDGRPLTREDSVLSPVRVDWCLEYKTGHSGKVVRDGTDITYSHLLYQSHLLKRLHERQGYQRVTAKRLWEGVDGNWTGILKNFTRDSDNEHLFLVPFEGGAFLVDSVSKGEFGLMTQIRPSMRKKHLRLFLNESNRGLIANTFIRKDQMFDNQLEILELIKEGHYRLAMTKILVS